MKVTDRQIYKQKNLFDLCKVFNGNDSLFHCLPNAKWRNCPSHAKPELTKEEIKIINKSWRSAIAIELKHAHLRFCKFRQTILKKGELEQAN